MRIVLLDHELYRLGLRLILERSSLDCEVLGEASTLRGAFEVMSAIEPSVVVMDTALPGLGAPSAIRKIRRWGAGVRVLVLTEHGRFPDVVAAMAAGASGYALKGDSNEEILAAIRRIAAGSLYLAPALDLRPEHADRPARIRHEQVVDI
ncbi:MAG TPA: response regulator transcription factor [Polyangia bacterium]|nr:response regulator transcription factor [Polyangia bacterium]